MSDTVDGFSVGDKVRKVRESADSHPVSYDKVYTVIETGRRNKSIVRINHNIGWWIDIVCLEHAVKGLCMDCNNNCKVDSKDSCGFFEERK